MEKVTSSVGARVATLNLWGRDTLVHSTIPAEAGCGFGGFDLYEGTC